MKKKLKREEKQEAAKNRRLDLFLQQLQIVEEKRKQIVEYVENLALETLQQKTPPRLRLKGV